MKLVMYSRFKYLNVYDSFDLRAIHIIVFLNINFWGPREYVFDKTH